MAPARDPRDPQAGRPLTIATVVGLLAVVSFGVSMLGISWRAGNEFGRMANAMENLSTVVERVIPQVADHERRISRIEGHEGLRP